MNAEQNPAHHDQAMALASGIAAFESKQFSRAVGLLRPLADTGNHEAQYRIAIMAQNGLGMQPNPLLAYHCMRSAAAAGVPPGGLAFFGIGASGRTGCGRPKCVRASARRSGKREIPVLSRMMSRRSPCSPVALSLNLPAAPGPEAGPVSRTKSDRPGLFCRSPTIQ